jgi:hypothetical protein
MGIVPSLSRQCDGATAQIIDTFLCKTAESLVNLPASMLSQFAEPSATGGYEYSATIFDAASTEIHSMSALAPIGHGVRMITPVLVLAWACVVDQCRSCARPT